jgi:hypothetical protein
MLLVDFGSAIILGCQGVDFPEQRRWWCPSFQRNRRLTGSAVGISAGTQPIIALGRCPGSPGSYSPVGQSVNPVATVWATSVREGQTIGEAMTAKSDFSDEEWHLILEAPPSAGMIVVTAQRGGTFRETIAMAKAYAEARQQHGESELLDEIVSAKPERDHTHYHSAEELKQQGLQHLRQSVEVLERKATPVEVDEYRQFIVNLTHKVAAAHREHGQDVSDPEQAAIDKITAALNPTAG